jgi:tetratricopeptide (TPR) repeat protein
MEYDEIIQSITGRLTGGFEKDEQMLLSETEKYRKHKYSQEITRAIGRIFAAIMPEEDKKEWDRLFSNDLLAMTAILDEVKLKIQSGQLLIAEKMIKRIMGTIEGLFIEDQVSVYFSFNNLLEELYYKSKYNPQKEIRKMPGTFNEILMTYAYLLVEKKEFNEAHEILNRGLKNNPLDTNLLFEKGEIYKINKDWKNFKEITDLGLEYSYSSKNIARAYRNYGYMFIELKDYEGAICCYLKSLHHENHTMAQSQLFYISQITDKKINPNEYRDKIDLFFEKNNILTCPNVDLLSIAFFIGTQLEEMEKYRESLFYYNILFDLTAKDEIGEKIKHIKNRIKASTH